MDIFSVTIGEIKSNSFSIPIKIRENQTVETLGLIDSGAGGKFIDQNYARKIGCNIQKLEESLIARNVDGTKNKQGTITSYVDLDLTICGRTRKTRLFVTGLGKQRIILGFPWLNEQNPDIDWKTGKFEWRKETTRRPLKIKRYHDQIHESTGEVKKETQIETEEPPTQDVRALIVEELEEIWVNTKTTAATELRIQQDEGKAEIALEDQIPREYHEFLDIFDEKKADRFPDPRPWDHKIEMKEGFVPKAFKAYNLTPEEQTELDKFLKDNLEKRYIRPSQSPMATPFFFVKKKDGKLRPCQDYRYLNEWTIKNAYPLPLISELMDKIKGAKYFTKLDVRWGYNNIRIKDGDQWKAAFKTNRGLFEPTVMFFGMCNSPATFQAMMDATFKDLIEEEKIIIYMDDIFIFAQDKVTLEENTRKPWNG